MWSIRELAERSTSRAVRERGNESEAGKHKAMPCTALKSWPHLLTNHTEALQTYSASMVAVQKILSQKTAMELHTLSIQEKENYPSSFRYLLSLVQSPALWS